MKFLLAGLGNIGTEYDRTRHNIGFDVADAFVIKHGGNFNLSRHTFLAECKWKGHIFFVIKPTTYMNLSGKALKYWIDKEKISIENVLVVLDDKAIPLGKLRLRPGGSDGGHNGLKNIQLLLQTTQYPRLRFGIGDNFAKGKQVDFVLGKWTPEEMPLVKEGVLKSIDIIECFASQGIEKAMNLYNK